jgi:hypothetical protein
LEAAHELVETEYNLRQQAKELAATEKVCVCVCVWFEMAYGSVVFVYCTEKCPVQIPV